MTLLILGVLLFAGVHFVPALAPGFKSTWQDKLGENGYKGSFSVLLLISFGLMIFGWQATDPSPIYSPLHALRHPAMGLVFIAFLLMVVASRNSRIGQWIRHPQLTGVLLWAIAHLTLNGDIRSVILFSGLAIWSCVEIQVISKREGAWIKPEAPAIASELVTLIIAVIVVVAIIFAHPYLAGVSVI